MIISAEARVILYVAWHKGRGHKAHRNKSVPFQRLLRRLIDEGYLDEETRLTLKGMQLLESEDAF